MKVSKNVYPKLGLTYMKNVKNISQNSHEQNPDTTKLPATVLNVNHIAVRILYIEMRMVNASLQKIRSLDFWKYPN